jgi:flavodoxin
MEAAQMGTSRPEVQKSREALKTDVANRKRPSDSQNLRWALKTPVPAGPGGQSWGDLYFAQEIAESLKKLGHEARVDLRTDVINSQSADDDVVLVLRGVERIRPQAGAINLLWVISHPSRISKHELKAFDAVFAASNSWAQKTTQKTGIQVTPLLQATNPEKFNSSFGLSDSGHEVLFVGNTRNEFRQVIKDCIEAGVRPTIYGKDWDRFVSQELIAGEFVNNEEVSSMYRSAGIVLNDHWPDMAREGFYSNRLFDAVASGGRIVSDYVQGVEELFDGAVQTYGPPSELATLCAPENRGQWGTNEEIIARATRIGQVHSFDQRVKELVLAVQDLI